MGALLGITLLVAVCDPYYFTCVEPTIIVDAYRGSTASDSMQYCLGDKRLWEEDNPGITFACIRENES